jgi:uncharacterized membrane protein (DUF373 family)
MLTQIVCTTLSYLRQGVPHIEPVLVVGIIAVVRCILVLTAAVSGTSGEMGLAITFEQSMIELGLLALTVLVLAVAVHPVRTGKGRDSKPRGTLCPMRAEDVRPWYRRS